MDFFLSLTFDFAVRTYLDDKKNIPTVDQLFWVYSVSQQVFQADLKDIFSKINPQDFNSLTSSK